MGVELNVEPGGNIVAARISGRLSREDYGRFVPKVEQVINEKGKVRVLFEMRDFHGWDAGALWEDIKFDLKHFADIERVAMIGDKKWEKWMATFCKPFTKAEIRYFDHSKDDEARAWIEAN